MKKIFLSKNINIVAFFNILGPIMLSGINFLVMPIFTRILGSENYGLYSIYVTWLGILTILIGLQTNSSIGTASIHIDKSEHKEYFSNVMAITLSSALILGSIIIIFRSAISEFTQLPEWVIIIMIAHALGAYGINFATGKFSYDKQGYKTLVVSVIAALLSIALALFFIDRISTYSLKYTGRIWGYSIPNIIIGFSFILYFLLRGKKKFTAKYWRFCLSFSLPMVFHALSGVVLAQSDRVMLQQFNGNSIVGIYSFSVMIAMVLNILWSALNKTWVPFYYEDLRAGKIDLIQTRTKNYLYVFTAATICFILISPELARAFAPQEFWTGIDTIPILCAGYYFVFLYSFSVNFEFYNKKTLNIAIGTSIAAVINIALNFLLIPNWGIEGAAIATLISYFLLFIFHEMIARFVIKAEYPNNIKKYSLGILSITICIAAFYFVKDYWYIRWIIAMVLGVILAIRTIKRRTIF